ncbi:hypothetical protein A2U01_0001041 [Trifolium medium]|uniref:Uncharacterized protein n=1 Tax=Trifolium medium TaxID=97028 RepID=A0A392LZ83_9FABA|nr:hypothetical protein [Trifolium medium]
MIGGGVGVAAKEERHWNLFFFSPRSQTWLSRVKRSSIQGENHL